MSMNPLSEAAWRLAAAGNDGWDPDIQPDANTVTPGVAGFLVMAFVAIAVILLAYDMNRRVRRIKFREEAREKIAAEQAAQEQTGAPDSQHDQ